MLHIYNSLTQQKEIFKPIHPGKVGLYVCGMTVYDNCHIGHARVWVIFDMITRYLRACSYEVTYVRNITDIDDKIIKRAQENQELYTFLTERVIQSMNKDAEALHVLPPNLEPRATDYIPHMITLIQRLLDKKLAYITDEGDVCYAVNEFKTYGELAHQELENLHAGARVAVANSKHDPLDFVLWKRAKADEPYWQSPWGEGRPGWHIECSAMAMDCLGETFDIHGGGADLLFPHHQNEIAQSEGATGKTFVNTWMHVGFVQVDKEKMSKSLGNFFTVKDVLAECPAEVVRYFLLASHYRSPVNYSKENLTSAQQALERLYISLRGLSGGEDLPDTDFEKRFNAAMDDDFNTPEALAVLFELAREINRIKESNFKQAAQLALVLKRLGAILGILQQNPESFLRQDADAAEVEKIEALIVARNEARKAKNWAEADKVREQLTAMGVSLEDTVEGTMWRRISVSS
jgi:cysteinyl-tRNA synthetase